MLLSKIKSELEKGFYNVLDKENIKELRPCQAKAIEAGLLERKNLLVCTPTASGKTLIAEMAALQSILNNKGKAVNVVPLRSLANEKFKDFKRRYGQLCRIALTIGNIDSADPYLQDYDLIITTAEKFDSLIRHHAAWLNQVSVVIFDEIHMLNDVSRGPVVEVLITIIKQLLNNVQILALSATIGNPKELAKWLDAKLIIDGWRPVELEKGTYFDGKLNFEKY